MRAPPTDPRGGGGDPAIEKCERGLGDPEVCKILSGPKSSQSQTPPKDTSPPLSPHLSCGTGRLSWFVVHGSPMHDGVAMYPFMILGRGLAPEECHGGSVLFERLGKTLVPRLTYSGKLVAALVGGKPVRDPIRPYRVVHHVLQRTLIPLPCSW